MSKCLDQWPLFNALLTMVLFIQHDPYRLAIMHHFKELANLLNLHLIRVIHLRLSRSIDLGIGQTEEKVS